MDHDYVVNAAKAAKARSVHQSCRYRLAFLFIHTYTSIGFRPSIVLTAFHH